MSGEKRSQDCEDTLHAETVIIVDIEGTTTSISFVKETLFPYVRKNLKQYIEKNWETEEFKGDLEKLKEQAKKDETDKVEGLVPITGATPEEERESLIKNVLWQMDGDRKTGALKQLQGHVWREAYESGAVKGHVYEDVPKAFEGWTKSGRKIYVYSSGSVDAQKLLFAHSEHGDMMKYFTDYFDTEVGAKQESSSYKNILAKIGAEPSHVLFLTDVVKEAQAAKEAGLSVKIVVRPNNAPLTDEEKVTFTTIDSFMDLSFQTSAKRQKVEKPDEKEIAEPESVISEPMDTSEGVPETSAEKVTEKSTEKMVESKTTTETAKVEETKIPEKSKVVDSMDVDDKIETEKKTNEAVDKPVPVEETKKKEEESKSNEKSEVKEEASPAAAVAKEDKEAPKKDNEVTKGDSNIAKIESTIAKEDSAIAKKDSATIKKDEETAKKEIETAKKDSEETKTEETAATSAPTTAAKLDSEPMDEDKNNLASKSEGNPKITEDKTEVPAKSADTVKTEQKTEAKAKPVDASNDKNAKTETDEKISSSSSDSSTEKAAECVIEKKIVVDEAPKADTTVEKVKPEVAPKPMDEDATTKSDDKPPAKDEKITDDVKQNGDREAAKKDEAAQSADKKESNGDSKEEKQKIDKVATVATVETTKASSPIETIEEKKEPVVESAKKDEPEVDAKAKVDEIATVESTDNKLNGTADDTDKKESEKPHRNGLNGDSSTEKSNGDTQNEAASSSQNGEAESSTDAASSAESIKTTKKVVDSTIVEGTGEPDVVPPVAVAATS